MSESAWADFVKRHRNGETNTDVARKVGVDPSTVGRWINGHTLATPQQAISFARIYNVHPIEALLSAGYLAPTDVEGEVTIETTASLESFSTRALIKEVSARLDVIAEYMGWVRASQEGSRSTAGLSEQVLRYIDPWTPPSEVKTDSFKLIFGEHLREFAEFEGVRVFTVNGDVGGEDDDDNLHEVDLRMEEHDLAATEDDTVVDPNR